MQSERRAVYANLLSRGFPTFFEMIFNNLHGMVDMIMIGMLGAVEIAAVGLTNEPNTICGFVFMALEMAMIAFISRLRGEGREQEVRALSVSYLALTLVLAVAVTVAAIAFARPVMLFMGAQADTIELAVAYFRVNALSFVFRRVYGAVTAIYRGFGRTKFSFRVNLVSNASNIVLNGVFIFGFLGVPAMGAVGAAWGTVVSCAIGCALSLVVLFGHSREAAVFSLHAREFLHVCAAPARRILKESVPFVAERVMVRVGVIMTVKFAASLGTIPFATHRILTNLMLFAIFGCDAIAATAMTYIGECRGAKDRAGERAYLDAAVVLSVAYTLVVGAASFFFSRWFILIYTRDAAVIALGAPILRRYAFVMPFQAVALTYSGAMRGAARPAIPTAAITVGIVLLRPSLAAIFLYVLGWGLPGVWLAIMADEFFRFAVLAIAVPFVFIRRKEPGAAPTGQAGAPDKTDKTRV